MSGLFKALSLALAVITVAILSIVIASCGGNNTQFRVVNAMSNPNAQFNFEVTISGGLVSPAGGLTFGGVQPATGYSGISSGTDPIEVFQTGTTSNPFINSSLNLSGGHQYTVALIGNSLSGQTGYAAQVFTDNNTLPSNGDVIFRVINAAPSLPGNVDIYFTPTTTCCVGVTPTFTGLAYGQSSGYASQLPGGQYYVTVTTPQGTRLFDQGYFETNGVFTIVLTDVQSGFTFSTVPILLTDAK